jgi:hypothetical protein
MRDGGIVRLAVIRFGLRAPCDRRCITGAASPALHHRLCITGSASSALHHRRCSGAVMIVLGDRRANRRRIRGRPGRLPLHPVDRRRIAAPPAPSSASQGSAVCYSPALQDGILARPTSPKSP